MELIQKMMLRPESIETAEKMYFSGRDYCYLRDRRAILVKKNGMIDTGTYFNAFSIYSAVTVLDLPILAQVAASPITCAKSLKRVESF